MGVYVFDMKMPKNCGACKLRASCVHRIYLERRADYCPLVYVPPHGRCIDADEFLKRAIDTKCFRGDYALMLEELVGESTTIIPADPAEEGE